MPVALAPFLIWLRSWRGLAILLLVAGIAGLYLGAPLKLWAVALMGVCDAAGAWSLVLFTVVFALWNLLLPPLPLQLLAGFACGLAGGFAVVFLGSTLAMVAGWLIARRLGRQWVERLMAGRPWLTAFDQAVDEQGWKAVILIRLSNVLPSNLVNLAFGLTRLRLRTIILAGWVGKLPAMLISVMVGAAGRTSLRSPEALALGAWTWVGLGLGFAATIATALLLGRRTRALLAAEA